MLKQGGPAWVGDNGGEIDIMEWVGTEPDYNNFSVHSHATSEDGQTITIGGKTCPYTVRHEITDLEDWHCYGVLWTHDSITGYFDGNPVLTVPNCVSSEDNPYWWPYDARYYVLLNMAIGGTWPGTPAATFSEATMEVDWLRVWQP